MSTTALFIIVKKWKQLNYPSINKKKNMVCVCVYTHMHTCSAIKRNGVRMHATT